MSQDKVDRIQSSSSGTIGRAVSKMRGQSIVLDSSSHPKDDAPTNSEAFLAAISSCGVTLIEGYAEAQKIPVDRMSATIEGIRAASDPYSFSRIGVRFEFAGVDKNQANALVDVWRER